MTDLIVFKNQIESDIRLIQKDFKVHDPQLEKDEYAFNYWILSRLYNIDEEIIPSLILEYHDKGIDCYAHFEETKELFIIQNKYYSEDSNLNRKEVSDFLTAPYSHLKNKTYKRSKELQRIFTNAIEDSEYNIWFDFYITNERRTQEHAQLFNDFNKGISHNEKGNIRGRINYLKDIYKLYFGESFKQNVKFSFEFKTVNKGTVLKILPEEYKLEGMSEAHYVMTPIMQLFEMYNQAIKKGYPIFEENIREYLGKRGVNGGIIKTLKDPDDRKNFFYYNNGITVICEKRGTRSGAGTGIKLMQPQIVNGCQTVNSINEVLSDYSKEEIKREFENVYVMVKVLIFNEEVKKEKPTFYQDIVKYTNKQNSINEKAFVARNKVFTNLQDEFSRRGFLLAVKPSDNYQFKEKYSGKVPFNKLLEKAKLNLKVSSIQLETTAHLIIPLEKLLQVFIALVQDGFTAYNKKANILKSKTDLFVRFSSQVHNYLTVDNMINLYFLYKRAEHDKKTSKDMKSPIPLYLISFLGYFLRNLTPNELNQKIETLFDETTGLEDKVYNFLRKVTIHYRKNNDFSNDYNSLIKQKIDYPLLDKSIETIQDVIEDSEIEDFLQKRLVNEQIQNNQ